MTNQKDKATRKARKASRRAARQERKAKKVRPLIGNLSEDGSKHVWRERDQIFSFINELMSDTKIHPEFHKALSNIKNPEEVGGLENVSTAMFPIFNSALVIGELGSKWADVEIEGLYFRIGFHFPEKAISILSLREDEGEHQENLLKEIKSTLSDFLVNEETYSTATISPIWNESTCEMGLIEELLCKCAKAYRA